MNNDTQNTTKSGRGRPSGPTFILVNKSQLQGIDGMIPISSKFAEMHGISGEPFGAKPKDYHALAPSKMQVDKVDFATKPTSTVTQNQSNEAPVATEEVAV